MRHHLTALALCAPLGFPVTVLAADWMEIPGYLAYVDKATIHRESYPKGEYAKLGTSVSYVVVWIASADKNGAIEAKIEVAYDCHGKMGLLQQIVLNETKDSPYHSFDQTSRFNIIGVQTKSTAPDSMYEEAQKLVCKPEGKH